MARTGNVNGNGNGNGAGHAAAGTEREPLLSVQRETTLDYATHVPEGAPEVDHKHYNLAGLSQANFWLLVSERSMGGRRWASDEPTRRE